MSILLQRLELGVLTIILLIGITALVTELTEFEEIPQTRGYPCHWYY